MTQLSQTYTILIVDDSESDRVTFLRYLQADSERLYRILEAETVEEGLEMWRSQQPDLVLIDLNLPDGDGLEFLEAIRVDRAEERIPAILLTGQRDEKVAVRAMKLGAADYLVKEDVTEKSFTTVVKQVLREAALNRQLLRSQQQQTVIAAMALRILEFLSLDDISNAIVKEVRQFINTDRAVIYQFNPDMSGRVIAEAIALPWQPCLNVQIEDTCFQENLGGAYCEGRVFVANDIYAANLTDCHIQMLEKFQVRATLAVPILLPNANKRILWGLLILHQCSAPRVWQESDIQLLQQLSVHLEIAIQQAIAYQQVQQLNQSLELKIKERTQELWQVNKFQQAILDGTDYAIIFTDLNGIIQTFNTGAEKMLGYSREEVIGKVTPEIFYDLQEVNSNITKASTALGLDLGLGFSALLSIASQSLLDEEWINIRKDGSRFPVSISVTILKDDNEQPIGTLSIRKDISDRKHDELLLKQQSMQKQTITQAIRKTLVVADILNVVTNELRESLALDRVAIYRFLPNWNGEFIAESVADGWVNLVGVDIHKVWEDTYLRENQGGRFRHSENMIVTDIYEAGLQPCHIDLLEQFQARAYAIAPIFVSGMLWGLLAMYINDRPYEWETGEIEVLEQIADQVAIAIQQANLYEQLQSELSIRKQTEEQLLKINDELVRATQLKDDFLANMSHELRTPLNSILGLSEALKDQVLGSLNESQIKAIDTVESSGEHLLSLINDILDLSKISSGMMELDIESVSVKSLCDSSLVFIKQQAFQKRVQVDSNIPAHINPIEVEERRIKQVLINLLTNAVKFTPSGGKISLLVSVGCGDTWQGEAKIPPQLSMQSSPTIVFQIVDTGIGIAPQDLQKLFQPFVQVDSALNRQYEGTGLGLALVKKIVELHGGQVTVESEVGKGSRFTIALPYEMSPSSVQKSELNTTTSLPLEIQPNRAIAPLILIAEDNEANIQTFSQYLRALNYRVIIANNGQQAIAMTKLHSPDVILMDIQMPEMDGLEAIHLIRADAQIAAVPIIALTALAMEGDRVKCLEAGANEYMAKPIKFKQLNSLIQQVLAL